MPSSSTPAALHSHSPSRATKLQAVLRPVITQPYRAATAELASLDVETVTSFSPTLPRTSSNARPARNVRRCHGQRSLPRLKACEGYG